MEWKKDLERRLKHITRIYEFNGWTEEGHTEVESLKKRIETALDDTPENVEIVRVAKIERAEAKAERRLKWATAAERKAEVARKAADIIADVIPFGQPILIGHHSEKSDRTTRNRMVANYQKEADNLNKADYHRSKAEAILKFGTRVKGDAERERQKMRETRDTQISVGSRVRDFAFGEGEIVRVNKKTYSIRFGSDWVTTRDKTYVKPV